ncbi:hypothetical protein, partial [Klebsiella pneumoniae]|uniref:hypothetical protein n=1 Tax=Klebsiella pneumoniae TaxID=573 RepID=UPI0024DE4011
ITKKKNQACAMDLSCLVINDPKSKFFSGGATVAYMRLQKLAFNAGPCKGYAMNAAAVTGRREGLELTFSTTSAADQQDGFALCRGK